MPVRDSGEDRGGCYRAGETDLVPRFEMSRAREKLPEEVRGWRVALRSPRWPTGQRGAARAEQRRGCLSGEEGADEGGPGVSGTAAERKTQHGGKGAPTSGPGVAARRVARGAGERWHRWADGARALNWAGRLRELGTGLRAG